MPPLAVVVVAVSVPADQVKRPVLVSVPVVVTLPLEMVMDGKVMLLLPKLMVPLETTTRVGSEVGDGAVEVNVAA